MRTLKSFIIKGQTMRILLPERKRKSDITSCGFDLQNEMVANKIMFEGFFVGLKIETGPL